MDTQKKRKLIESMQERPYDGLFGVLPSWAPPGLIELFNKTRENLVESSPSEVELTKLWGISMDIIATGEITDGNEYINHLEKWFSRKESLDSFLFTCRVIPKLPILEKISMLNDIKEGIDAGPIGITKLFFGCDTYDMIISARSRESALKSKGKERILKHGIRCICEKIGSTSYSEFERAVSYDEDVREYSELVEDLYEAITDPISIHNVQIEDVEMKYQTRNGTDEKRKIRTIKNILSKIKL